MGNLFTEAQLKAAVAAALRNRDQSLNDSITLAIELEGARARIAELEQEMTALRESRD